MKYLLGKFLIILFLPGFLFTGSLFGQDVIPRPEGKQKLVYDYAGFFNQQEANELNNLLENFALETSNQILVLTVKTLNDLEPYAYAEQVLSTWGIGQKDMNNGIVVLIKPKTSDSRGQVFISTGYGLEGAIPDATGELIVQNEMIPRFKHGDNYLGVLNGVSVLMELAKGEINAGEYQKRSGGGGGNKSGLLPILFMIIIFIFVFGSKASQARKYANTNNMAFWAAFWLLANQNKSHGGSWGGFTGGGGGFGGGGGGGFGGFGGGMGGGGGAGGSW